MARNFVIASAQWLTRSAAVLTTPPFTFACWARPSSIDGLYHTLLSISNGSSTYHALYMNPSGGASAYSNQGGGVSGEGASSTNATVSVWGHFAAVFTSTTSRTGVFNGTAGTANATSVAPAGLNLTQIGTLWTGTNSFPGDIAEAGIWSVALDAGELAALAAGVSPTLIRPSALVAYWPLIGQMSPEIDPVGRNELTLTNAPTAVAHPRIIYPHVPQWKRQRSISGALAADATLTFSPTANLVALSRFAADATLTFSVTGAIIFAYDIAVYIGGIDRTAFTNRYECEIQDILNETPNTASLMVRGFTPTVGQTVTIVLGVNTTIFSGLITDYEQVQRRTGTRLRYRIDCTDWTFLLDRRLVNTSYTSTAANTVVTSIMSAYTTGFTTTNVQAGLATIDLPNKFEVPSQALTRAANLAGAFWYVDYDKDLHFRTSENLTNPATLNATNKTFKKLRYKKGIQQIRTRVYVEGAGSVLLADVATEATNLAFPMADVTNFSSGVAKVTYNNEVLSSVGKSTLHGAATNLTANAVAGAASISVTSNAGLEGFGWLLIANQYIYYNGKTGGAQIDGVPASGPGSISSTLPSGSQAIQVPALYVGTHSAAKAGTAVNLIVQRDDVTAQAALAALEGGDGIHEHYIQDRRLSITGANARGDAELTLGKDPDEQALFTSEDANAASGRSVTINTDGISTTVKMQQVRIYWIPGRRMPQRDVTATNRFKGFYEYVRDLQDKATKVA